MVTVTVFSGLSTMLKARGREDGVSVPSAENQGEWYCGSMLGIAPFWSRMTEGTVCTGVCGLSGGLG